MGLYTAGKEGTRAIKVHEVIGSSKGQWSKSWKLRKKTAREKENYLNKKYPRLILIV